MRDYAKVAPKLWHGETFKALRKRGSEGVIVGLYLLTSPSSNMLGMFTQPVLYMAHETGLGQEGALKGLQDCIEAGFCSYDHDSEVVWVHEMAKYQIADDLKATDLRCKGIQKDYDALPKNPFLGPFFDLYQAAFHMTSKRDLAPVVQAPSKAPMEPLRSQEQEQEKEQEQEAGTRVGAANAASPAPAPAARGSRLSSPWALPKPWGEWALEEFPTWTADVVRSEAAKFADFWHAKTGKDATKLDWLATWRNWCRNARPTVTRAGHPGQMTDEQRTAANAAETQKAKDMYRQRYGLQGGDIIDGEATVLEQLSLDGPAP